MDHLLRLAVVRKVNVGDQPLHNGVDGRILSIRYSRTTRHPSSPHVHLECLVVVLNRRGGLPQPLIQLAARHVLPVTTRSIPNLLQKSTAVVHLVRVHETKQNPANFFALRGALFLTLPVHSHLHRDEIRQQVLQQLYVQEVVLRALLLVLLEQLARVLVRVAAVVRPTPHRPPLPLLKPDQQRITLLVLDDAVLVRVVPLLPARLALPQFCTLLVTPTPTRSLVALFDRGVLHAAARTSEAVQTLIALEVLAQRAVAAEPVAVLQNPSREHATEMGPISDEGRLGDVDVANLLVSTRMKRPR